MKLVVLTAIIATVTSSPLTDNSKWPWQVGKEYVYDVDSYTWTKFENSDSNGNAFMTKFVIRVQAPGKLTAKLENPLYAQIQGQMDINDVPSDLKYEPVQKFDEAFEIVVDGGRIVSLAVPPSFSNVNFNLLKGLVSALQVDLSTYGHLHNFPNSFDKKTFQGLFKKMEADVTGDCETLYSVSPVSAEVRRELPAFAVDPIEITKSKNYGSCKRRVDFAMGVPEGAVWQGIAYKNDEKQFIKHTSESRILAGKQGTIYKTEILSSVFVNPLLFGKQKAEVYSYVGFTLTEVKPIEDATKWNEINSDDLRTGDLLLTNNDASFFKVDAANVVNGQKLLQEITPLLQDPSNLPKANFLSKFNLLVRFVMFMDAEQLTQMTSSIEVAKTSKNVSKSKMWAIYRDAVAQAGTIAAFEEIKAWILTKKIQGEEAASVIGSIAGSLGFHTEKVSTEFFDLAFSPEVVEQKVLNTSALLAATKFFSSGKQELFVVEKVIPRLSQELKKAVEEGDSGKAQVYVRTLGNLVRPEILEVFAPYLDGRIAVTKYLRIQIVISLKPLANLKNEQVRAVLFSILRNTAEPYDVRVAAALNIFLAFPTAEMMQVMAHMTNDDPSTQVRAVLATSIGFAANLKDARFAELAKTAQSVSNFVTKEKYGYRYSTDSIIDTSADGLAHFRELSYIGSENSFLPKYHRSALRLRGTGTTEENWITLSVSDVQNLFDYITRTTFIRFDKSETDFKFTAKKIIEELNIKRQPRNPVEGALFIDSLNQQRLITFSENELPALIEEFFEFAINLEDQKSKVVIGKQVLVTFPLAAGMPFVFTYTEPIVFVIQGKSTQKFGMDNSRSVISEINYTYARNMEGSVGFFDTFSGNYASSGIINKFQINIPAKLTTTAKMTGNKVNNLKFTFVLPEKDANLIHLSVYPYTTMQKMHATVIVAEDSNSKVIKRSAPVLATDVNLGQLVGVGLYLKGYSYSSDYKKNVFAADILTNIRNLLYQNDVAYTKFDLKYVAKDTKNKEVATSFFFDNLYNQKESGEIGPATVTSDVTPNSDVRRKELVKRVASGIESARVRVVDISTVFDGEDKKEFVFTAALANSVVDNKVQAAVFAKGCEQFNAVFRMIKPKIAPLNFEDALKNQIKALYEAELKFGNSENIIFKGTGERSEQFTEQLKKDPLAEKCLKETSNNNNFQKDCYEMIIKAHAPDFFKGTVTYKNVDPAHTNASYNMFLLYKHFTTFEVVENPLEAVKDGIIEIEAQAFYYKNLINYKFTSKFGAFRMNNAEGLSHYPYTMAIYAPVSNWERSYNCFTGYQYMPYCAVDNSKIWTFSGRSYDYSLTGSWHAVMVDETTDLTILARRPSDNQEEIYITYKNQADKYVEIDIKPTAVEVKSNAEKVASGEHTIYWDATTDSALLEYYTLADGVQVFLINGEALRVVYDKQRLVIFTADHRSTTRGICGQSSSQTSDDYLTPYGLVDLPELYGASFSLDGEFSDPKTAELKKEAKLKAYQPVTEYTNILRSDAEWSKAENESVKA